MRGLPSIEGFSAIRWPFFARTSKSVAGICILFLCLTAFAQSSWPRFRGPNGSGVAEGDYPVFFSPQTNVVWKTAIPSGHSSPCIFGDRIFLTGFENEKLEVLCLNRLDGQVLWRQAVPTDQIDKVSRIGSPATATPVTDGQNVYAYFGSFGLICFNADGKEVWRKPLSIPVTQHGAGTSPILSDKLVLLQCDQDVGSYLLAVDRRDGKTVWKTERSGVRRGFGTPMLWPEDKPQLVIAAGSLRVTAYRLEDGKEEWSAKGLPNEMCSSPVSGAGFLFVGGWTSGSGVKVMPGFDALLQQGDANQDGKLSEKEAPNGPAKQHFPYIDANKDGFITRDEWDAIVQIFTQSQNQLLAIRPDGHGDVTETHVAWKQTRGLPYVPTPLFYRDRLWLVKNGGIVTCLNATNGTALFQEERLGAMGDYYSSPVAGGGKVYFASQAGLVTVAAASDELSILARNEMGEPVMATPALLGQRIYLRTARFLYAFGITNP